MKKRHLFFCFLISLQISLFAQHKIDSLKSALDANANDDTTKVKTLLLLSAEYKSIDQTKMLELAEKAKSLAEKNRYKIGLANAYKLLGYANRKLGNGDVAVQNYQQCISINKEIGNVSGEYAAYVHLGNYYTSTFDYPKAIVYNIKALKLIERLKDSVAISGMLTNIGLIYSYQKKYKVSESYYRKAIQVGEMIHDDFSIANATMNLAGDYMEQKDIEKAKLSYEKVLPFYKKLGERVDEALVYGNLAHIHSEKKEYDKAIQYAFKALEITESVGDKFSISIEYGTIAEIYKKMNKIEKAIEYYEKAIKIDQEIKNWDDLKNCSFGLLTIYKEKGDYKMALAYQDIYIEAKDSVFNSESTKQLEEINTKYQTEKKDNEIKLLNKDREAQALKQKYTLAGLSLVIALALVLSYAFIQKRKANVELFKQKSEIAHQKEIIEEKNKEVTDSINYAKRIQHAVFPTNSYLKRFMPEYFVFFKPKDIVSGDFYWAHELTDGTGRFLLATADCTGHGVPGAFMSLISSSLLNEIVMERKIYRPDLILNELRSSIIKALNQDGADDERKDGMDIVLLFFDLKNMLLEYASANNAFYIQREQFIMDCKADKFPVGKYHTEEKPFTYNRIQLMSGDIVYTLTDGIVDQFGGPERKKLMTKNFKRILPEIATLDMNSQKEYFNNFVDQWKGSLKQIDDITLIGIKIS